MNKYLIIFKAEFLGENSSVQIADHTVEAEGFTKTDFDVVFWNNNGYGDKVNIAFYQISHVICVRKIEYKDKVTAPTFPGRSTFSGHRPQEG